MGNDLPVYVIPLLCDQVCWHVTTDCSDVFTCNIWVNEQYCKSLPLYVHCIFFVLEVCASRMSARET